MDLYKIIIGEKYRTKRKYYESKKTFDTWWQRHASHYSGSSIIAYKLDYKKKDWKEIRRVNARR